MVGKGRVRRCWEPDGGPRAAMVGSRTFARDPHRAESRNHAEMSFRLQPKHCSHVHRPPSVHMGARQLILTAVKNPHNYNENQPSSSEGPSLPCAVPASARIVRLLPSSVSTAPRSSHV